MLKRLVETIIKLGGSLITDKSRPYTVLEAGLKTAARAIAEAYPRLGRLVIVHGGGSFGHYEVTKVTTKHGKLDYGEGLAKVSLAMLKLNQMVVEELVNAGIPAISIPTHAICVYDCEARSLNCSLSILEAAVLKGMVPVMNGDAIMSFGACPPAVVSGDDIVVYLAKELGPARAIFLLDVDGVHRPIPGGGMGELLLELATDEAITVAKSIEAIGKMAERYDVTGGIASKLLKASECVEKGYCTEAIFVGGFSGELKRALIGEGGTFTVIKKRMPP